MHNAGVSAVLFEIDVVHWSEVSKSILFIERKFQNSSEQCKAFFRHPWAGNAPAFARKCAVAQNPCMRFSNNSTWFHKTFQNFHKCTAQWWRTRTYWRRAETTVKWTKIRISVWKFNEIMCSETRTFLFYRFFLLHFSLRLSHGNYEISMVSLPGLVFIPRNRFHIFRVSCATAHRLISLFWFFSLEMELHCFS